MFFKHALEQKKTTKFLLLVGVLIIIFGLEIMGMEELERLPRMLLLPQTMFTRQLLEEIRLFQMKGINMDLKIFRTLLILS